MDTEIALYILGVTVFIIVALIGIADSPLFQLMGLIGIFFWPLLGFTLACGFIWAVINGMIWLLVPSARRRVTYAPSTPRKSPVPDTFPKQWVKTD